MSIGMLKSVWRCSSTVAASSGLVDAEGVLFTHCPTMIVKPAFGVHNKPIIDPRKCNVEPFLEVFYLAKHFAGVARVAC
jgi:hypothetical protein